MKRYHLTTFGCQMNEHDSERMKGMLESLGYSEAPERGEADLILFNTCSIRETADSRFVAHLGEAKRLKREQPERIVGVGGCWAQSVKEEVFERFPFVDVAFGLRELEPDSVPVNFLMPFPGTPLAGRVELTPGRCLRVLALFRFVFPAAEVRIAGGREMHLRSLQPLGLHIANSIFLGDYLTSEGAPGTSDRQMIADAGFVVEGQDSAEGAEPTPTVRRRGPGTAQPANA